jgi:PST family polysaccharide transporter
MRIGVLAVMARLVTPHDFGVFSMALIFTSFAERMGQVGVGAAFVQRAAVDPDDLRTATLLSLVSGVVICAVLTGAAPIAALIFQEPSLIPVLGVLAVGFIIDSLGVVSDGMLQRELRFRDIVKAEMGSFLFGIVGVGVLLAWFGLGLWALVWGNISMRVAKAALLVSIRPPGWDGRWSRERAKSLLSTGIGFSLGKILNFLSLQGDNFVVGRILGAEALGMYTRAYQAMTLPAMYVGQAFERVLFPAMSQRQDDPHALRRGFLASLEVSTLVGLPVGVLMFALSREIVVVLFGEVWIPVIPVLGVLSFGVFFRTAYKCSDVVVRSKGDVYSYAARQAWYTAIIVGGACIGATMAGLKGVSYAVVLGVAINYLLMTRLAGRLSETSMGQLLHCHLPGLWVAVWMGIFLALALPTIRSVYMTPLGVLISSSCSGFVVAVVAWMSSWILFPDSFARPTIYRIVKRIRVAWEC